MPVVKEIRNGNSNNLIEVEGRLYIEGQEYTFENFAPISLSFGPSSYPQGDASTFTSNVSQLALGRVYTRGGSGIRSDAGSAGNYNTPRLATGHTVLPPWVYSTITGLYYGPSHTSTPGEFSSFDSNFALAEAGFTNLYPTLVTASVDGVVGTGSFFLPKVDSKWIGVGVSASTEVATAFADNRGRIVLLYENGTSESLKAYTHQVPYLPYIGDDWAVVAGFPFSRYTAPSNTYQKIDVVVFDRSTGTETSLNDSWYLSSTHSGIGWDSIVGVSPSNTLAGDEGEYDFYVPALSSTDLILIQGHLYDMDTETPRIENFVDTHTITIDNINNYIVCNTYDIPNHSRVFIKSSSGIPGGITASQWYWTIRQSATQSKLAVSLAAAQGDDAIDITSNGSGTITVYIPKLVTKTGGEAGEPADTSAVDAVPAWNDGGSKRQVQAWAFTANDVNYLSVGIMEPGTSTTVAANTHLYTWRLDTASTATYFQKVETGAEGRVRAYFLLDTTRKRIVVVYDDRLIYYVFNPAVGWVKQSTQNIAANNVGVDSSGRLWVTTSGSTYISGGQELRVYEPSGVATNVTVTFQSNSYAFTGEILNSNIICNAYDTEGQRVETGITLTRMTTNFQFAGGASTVNVTTSTEGNLLVPITVTGTGLLRCRATPT